MKYDIFLVSVLSSFLLMLPVEAFRLPFSPLDHIRYRAGACEDSLERVVYALLKQKVHNACLGAALEGLQQTESLLSRQFGRRYNLKNRQFQVNYDPVLKQVLRREILARLGKTDDTVSFLDQSIQPKQEIEQSFISYINRFCHHRKGVQEPYGQERVQNILEGLQALNINGLFEGFRYTLLVAKTLENKKPQLLKDMKRLRERFLIVINHMIVLKKVLAGKKIQEGEDIEDVMRKIVLRTEWIKGYAELRDLALQSRACKKDHQRCLDVFQDMDQLALIVQSFDDLKNLCWFNQGMRPKKN